MDELRRILAGLTTRQKVIGGAVLLYILALAVVGFILTIDLWAQVISVAVTVSALVCLARLGLEYLKEKKAGEYLAQTSAFVFAFLQAYGQPPVPVKIPSNAEQIRRMAEIHFERLVAIVKVRLLLHSADASGDIAVNCDLTRLWLLQYAVEYGKQNNIAGGRDFPYFYPVLAEVSGLNLEIAIVIADNGAAVRFIKDLPQPPPPDPEQYKDEDFL